MKKQVKLYNVMFPIWLLWLFPLTMVFCGIGNFIIDFLVLTISMKALKISEPLKKAKSYILTAWIYGFLADIIGAIILFIVSNLFNESNSSFGKWWEETFYYLHYDPYHNIYSALMLIFAFAVAAIFIYIFNIKFVLKKLDVDDAIRRKLALSMAIFTAPYLFLIPSKYMY